MFAVENQSEIEINNGETHYDQFTQTVGNVMQSTHSESYAPTNGKNELDNFFEMQDLTEQV